MRQRILLATDRPERAALIELALTRAHHEVIARIAPDDDLEAYVAQGRPDALMLELEAPAPEVLRQLQRLLAQRPLPVAVFADRSDNDSLRLAMKAGAGAYVVDGFRPSRVATVLEAARLRFAEIQSLRRERDAAVARQTGRAQVQRAKAILMRQRGPSEEAAHAALRRMAADAGRDVAEAARIVIAAEDKRVQDMALASLRRSAEWKWRRTCPPSGGATRRSSSCCERREKGAA